MLYYSYFIVDLFGFCVILLIAYLCGYCLRHRHVLYVVALGGVPFFTAMRVPQKCTLR
jgi:hypothetical protein